MKHSRKTLLVSIGMAIAIVGGSARLAAELPKPPPLPPGFMYQAVPKTAVESRTWFTAEELDLPPLPPGLVSR